MGFLEVREHKAALEDWLQTPLGRALLKRESRLVEEACDGIFGVEFVQIGLWGEGRELLRHARTQRTTLLAGDSEGQPDVVGQPYCLPLQSDSVDAVLLPHTLDFCDRPHDVLREVDRVLRADGRIVILGFKTGGLWGLRRQLPGGDYPPGLQSHIPDRQLSDWLRLLNMRIQAVERYFFQWPRRGNRGSKAFMTWERRGQRWWPELAACYMLTAQKRVYTLTPVKKRWLSQPKVVGGLVKPTTRITQVRFGKDS